LLEEGLVDNTDVGVIEHFSLVEPMVHAQLVFEHSFSSLGLFGSVVEDFVNANFLKVLSPHDTGTLNYVFP